MKKLYAIKFQANKRFIKLILLTVVLLSASFMSYSQVRVPFTPRTSDYTPGQTVYNVKGDFTMIGNTNLTLVNYSDTRDNGFNDMRFVDVDGDPNTSNSSSSTLALSTENGANPECSNIVYAGLYWTGRNSSSFSNTQRRTVKFRGPNQSYQTIVADADDIRYPGDSNMFAAYKEVTHIVRNGGLGEYFVADIALTQGSGGGTGYYGGWGMVVVYENSKMNWRDVTVFDGYAYVQGSTSINHTLNVSGFNTVQNGDVNVRLGMMAGEGDVSISGDYFQIRRQSDNQFQSLNHSGNYTGNFFNSSIETGGNSRNPNLNNNTGLDIAMFDVPNLNNSVIGNNQTSTQFRYGSTQDTYIIFNITFSVDAYIPESEGLLTTNAINGMPPVSPYVVEPGDVVEYGVEIRNLGTEAIEDGKLIIPIPYTADFVPGSITYNEYNPLFQASPPYFAPNQGATGAVVWDISYLPLNPIDASELMADIQFEISTTTDCSILVNNDCAPKIVIVGGEISGTGVVSGNDYSLPLIQGYQLEGVCQGEPNVNPIEIDINSAQYIIDNCTDVSVQRDFFYCDFDNNSIPISAVSGNFPAGSRFYDSYPVTDSSIEYTTSNPFPATIGVSTYYAVPPGDTGCSYIFTIEITEVNTVPTTEDVVYCLNETAVDLTATPTDPNYVVLFYPDNDPSTPGLLTLTPSTSTAGTFTYYVAEGPSTTCVGEKTPITVTVYDEIEITLESITPTTCLETTIGAIDISVTGGSEDYTYTWDDPANSTTQDISGLAAGTYTVTVSNTISNCTATASIEVLEEENDTPIITVPNGFEVDGCSEVDVVTGDLTSLPYNENIITITEAEFLAEGGTITDDNVVSVSYQDSSSGSCPLVVTRTFTVTDACDATATDTQTITINSPEVLANAPTAMTTDACDYADQAAVDAAFNTWLDGFTVSGGCNATGDYGTPTAPLLCDG
ncbi:SprB repeat-containing protein, partial [Xanthomarina sp. F1114]|uniref:SprB repeat-containing protein n=1 Tax=Xanthomarina sp. F1114 TaxID=2996019 RepID=UPI00225E4A4C